MTSTPAPVPETRTKGTDVGQIPTELGVENPIDAPCVYCGSDDTWVYLKLEPKPLGSYSLAGFQTKHSSSPWPYARCGGCGHESKGKV